VSIRLVTRAYLLAALATAAWVAATNGRVTSHGYGIAGLVLGVLLVVAVVPFRQRWAWWLLIVIESLGAAAIVGGRVEPLAYIADLVGLGLLVSPQMRAYVARGLDSN
jgi:hypothetical protein